MLVGEPILDMAKVNFDGAIFNKEQKTGINVVIRDAQGAVLASLSRILPQIHSPFEVEAIQGLPNKIWGLRQKFYMGL